MLAPSWLAVVLLGVPEHDDTLGYRCTRTGTVPLVHDGPCTASMQPLLAGQLVIPPAVYCWQNVSWDLRGAEGAYRFFVSNRASAQRIVYNTSIVSLLSGIAWTSSHGSADGSLYPCDSPASCASLETFALTRKLSITCGNIAAFGKYLLTKYAGWDSRILNSHSLPPWNTYDDGHVMLEVADVAGPGTGYTLVDLDNNLIPCDNETGLYLTGLDFYRRVHGLGGGGGYTIAPLAADTPLDVSGFRGYVFYSEFAIGTEVGLRHWYAHILGAITSIYFPKGSLQAFTCNNQSRTSHGCTPQDVAFLATALGVPRIEPDAFERTFYGGGNSSPVSPAR